MPTLREQLSEEANTKSEAILSLFESKKAGPNEWDLNDDEMKLIADTEKELTVINQKLMKEDEKERAFKAAQQTKTDVNAPRGGPRFPAGESDHKSEQQVERKSLGQLFVESDAFKKYNKSERKSPEVTIETKTVIDTATGYAPQAIRTGYISQFPTRPIAVIDVIPQGTTNQTAVVYMEETTFTNSAAETTQGNAAPQSLIQFTERSAPVRKIATYVAVTDELMEDAEAAEAYVNNRLAFMVRQRLDQQIISGNGIAPNLLGILNVSGVQVQARGGDNNADACHKAITLIRSVGFAEPTAHILHPTNWETIHLMKTSTGEYIYGAPWTSGPGTLWGIPVVPTVAISSGTGLTGAFTPHCEFDLKRDMTITVGFVNDDMIKGQLSILASLRGALPVYRPTAFCQETGLA